MSAALPAPSRARAREYSSLPDRHHSAHPDARRDTHSFPPSSFVAPLHSLQSVPLILLLPSSRAAYLQPPRPMTSRTHACSSSSPTPFACVHESLQKANPGRKEVKQARALSATLDFVPRFQTPPHTPDTRGQTQHPSYPPAHTPAPSAASPQAAPDPSPTPRPSPQSAHRRLQIRSSHCTQ